MNNFLFNLFFVLSCLIAFNVNAQFSIEAQALVTDIDEPRILVLKNGNTALVNYFEKSIAVSVYDENHKLKFKKVITPKDGAYSWEHGTFEIDGNIVTFFRKDKGSNISLYREVISAENGSLIRDERIQQITWSPVFAGFEVRKDEFGDNYAIVLKALFNTKEANKQLELVLYNGQHQELNRSFIERKDAQYKFLSLSDLLVVGDNAYATVIESNQGTGESYGRPKNANSSLVLVRLSSNGAIVEQIVPSTGYVNGSGLKRNPRNNSIYVIDIDNEIYKDNSLSYNINLIAFKSDLSKSKTHVLTTDKLQSLAQNGYGKWGMYAVPQNIFFYEDTTFAVLYTDRSCLFSSLKDLTRFSGDVGLVLYNKDYSEKSAAYLPLLRDSYALNDNWGPRTKVFDDHLKGDYLYVDRGYGGVVFLDDVKGNQNRVEAKKSIWLENSTSKNEPYFVNFKPGSSIPARQLLSNKDDVSLRYLKRSAFNKETMTVILFFQEGKQLFLDWIKLK